jgi:hypothetical protein
MVAFHVVLECPQKSEVEDCIVAELTKYIHCHGDKDQVVKCDREKAAELNTVLGSLHLAAVHQVNSLLLYFYCGSVSEMYTLTQLLEYGHLKVIIEEVFSILTSTSAGLNVSVRLHDQQQFTDCYNQLLIEGR